MISQGPTRARVRKKNKKSKNFGGAVRAPGAQHGRVADGWITR